MPDIIKLLPDSVANQIAAGEVVQRPASVVKELFENSVDAGAKDIRLVIKDAGKTLIQVIDNGCGMSERDARMCFERHATSKIQTANDLLVIRTLGFRGEALASIASVAQLELKTKCIEDEIGTCIQVEGSDVKSQFPSTCSDGTTISVRNLFYNVPARRNFLKSNTLELKYIIDEFFRIALVHPGIGFTFINNEKILYKLTPSNLRQRVVTLLGNHYNQKLIPVEQSSAIVSISGFIGKPEFVKKSRGEQYFFTNKRFIKSPYLHHAVENAYQDLIPKDAYPTYLIYLTIDPKMIDVNIHPTKTEINFLDMKNIYAILHSSVRQSIGKYNLTPTFDFEADKVFSAPPPMKEHTIKQPAITIDPSYNPFEKKVKPQIEMPLSSKPGKAEPNWQRPDDPLKEAKFASQKPYPQSEAADQPLPDIDEQAASGISPGILQVSNRFIITYTQNDLIVIDQQKAHERILFERFLSESKERSAYSQQQLLPQTLNLSASDSALLKEFMNEFNASGFEIAEFGKDTFIISAIPADCSNENITDLFDSMLESLQNHPNDPNTEKHQKFVQGIAKSLAVNRNRKLHPEEMISLVGNLFACSVPHLTPDGKPTLYKIGFDELGKKFK